MASFVLYFFPLDVLDEIWDLNESVSEGFLTYSCLKISVSTIVTESPVRRKSSFPFIGQHFLCYFFFFFSFEKLFLHESHN